MNDTNATETTAKNPVKIRSKRRLTEFVETETSKQILNALTYAMVNNDLAVIYGWPGLGKTRTISHFVEHIENAKSGHVWLCTISPSVKTVVPMLGAIGEAVGVVARRTGARELFDRICSRLATTKRCLLVIDEAQHLDQDALEEIRAIHDSSGAGIALVGNDLVYKRLVKHPQIHSRIGLRLPLPRPLEADVQALVVARVGKAADDSAIELLEEIATLPGALRLVVKVLEVCKGKPKVDAKMVRTACKVLGVELGSQ